MSSDQERAFLAKSMTGVTAIVTGLSNPLSEKVLGSDKVAGSGRRRVPARLAACPPRKATVPATHPHGASAPSPPCAGPGAAALGSWALQAWAEGCSEAALPKPGQARLREKPSG